MNLANKITITRVLMIPVFLLALLGGTYLGFMEPQMARYVSVGIFIVASATDALDGYIARSRNMITNLGKFMDPLADKLLVAAALISMVQLGDLQAWIVILIISREFIITGFRTIAASNKIVLAASFWAKLKTIFQMLMIIFVLTGIQNDIFQAVCGLLIVISVVLTIVSAIEYIYKNRQVLKDQN